MTPGTRRTRLTARRARTDGAAQGNRDLLALALFSSIRALEEYEGRAGGLKFNKLAFAVYKRLSRAQDPGLHFPLPHRWYLHGAVVDDFAVRDLVRFDHPEDETRTTAIWIPKPPRLTPKGSEGAREEIEAECTAFIRRLERSDDPIPDMLREHYRFAPLDFQRDFLEWTLLAKDILRGYHLDIPERAATLFSALATSFPRDVAPALGPALDRLVLYLEPLLRRRAPGGMEPLRQAFEMSWEFWAVFCLFLSMRYNEGVPPSRLAAYRQRSEKELVAFKRRLSSYLEEGYIREGTPTSSRASDAVGRALANEVVSEFLGGN